MQHYKILLSGMLLMASTSAPAVQCYEGVATINSADAGVNCTATEKGYVNASAGPFTHDGCTQAKANAAAKLRARVQQSCRTYVRTNQSCDPIKLNQCN